MPDSGGHTKKGGKGSSGKGGEKDSTSGSGRQSREASAEVEQTTVESTTAGRSRSRSGYN